MGSGRPWEGGVGRGGNGSDTGSRGPASLTQVRPRSQVQPVRRLGTCRRIEGRLCRGSLSLSSRPDPGPLSVVRSRTQS